MSKRLRYVVVVLTAIFVIATVSVATDITRTTEKQRPDETEVQNTADTLGELSFGSRESTVRLGNPQIFSSGDTSEETSSEETEEETTEVEETTGEETTEETTEAKEYVGLEAYFQDKVVVNNERASYAVNIRAEMDEDSEVVDVLVIGQAAQLIEENGDWYEISHNSVTGYVNSKVVLTGSDAYRQNVSTVGYVATALQDETVLLDQPNAAEGTVIQHAQTGNSYRITGLDGEYYAVEVASTHYSTLYVKQSDVVVTYLFLGVGTEADNGLNEEDQEVLATADLTGNMELAIQLSANANNQVATAAATSTEGTSAEISAATSTAEIVAANQVAAEAPATAAPETAAPTPAPTEAPTPAPTTAAPTPAPTTAAAATAHVNNVALSGEDTAYALQLCNNYGVDSSIIFSVMYHESRFNASATSGSGAQGLMQIIPRYSGARMAKLGVSNLYDIRQNMAVGIDMLAEYYNTYGNWTSALTRYRYGTPDAPNDYAQLVLGSAGMFK